MVSNLNGRALAMLTDQCNELAGANAVLAQAIRDIEGEALAARQAMWADETDRTLDSIIHICQTGGVRAALEAS